MAKAMDETNRRRKVQLEYNKEHNITPETIRKEIRRSLTEVVRARKVAQEKLEFTETEYDRTELAAQIEKEMLEAAEALDFERAAFLRDQLKELKELPELVSKGGKSGGMAKRERSDRGHGKGG
jgi:excinuclease ABC subunit B